MIADTHQNLVSFKKPQQQDKMAGDRKLQEACEPTMLVPLPVSMEHRIR